MRYLPNDQMDEIEMDIHNNQWGFDFYMRTGTTNFTIFYNEFMDAVHSGEFLILQENC